MTIVVTLAGVPVGKGRPKFARRGNFVSAYTPEKTRTYEQNLALAAQAAMVGRAPVEGPLEVRVLAVFPVPESWSAKKRQAAIDGKIRPTTKPDADNLLKVLDSLNQVAWADDKQIVAASIVKYYGAKPLYRVEIEQLSEGVNDRRTEPGMDAGRERDAEAAVA